MNRNYWRNKLEHFGVPKHSKIVYYKNPNECNNYYMERVNPTHIGILWGHRKDKSHNFIALCFYGIVLNIDTVGVFLCGLTRQ